MPTIHFHNTVEAQDLLGRDMQILRRLEELFGLRMTFRDVRLDLEGDEAGCRSVEKLVHHLQRLRNGGNRFSQSEILYTAKAFRDGRDGEVEAIHQCRIEVGRGKQPVFPKTLGQSRYVQSILQHDISICVGPAGTGKTYLAMALAVSALLRDDVSRIILTRPAIEAGEALGYLPGDLQAKVMPYLRPLYDALYDVMQPDDIERHIDRGVIEVAPLAYMRGRTLNHAFVILDEAQNTTSEQMLMFLTRLGIDSKCVVTGDSTQIDLPPSKSSGLIEAEKKLNRIEGIAITHLDETDVVRHELVQQIIRAYQHVTE